LGSAWGLSVAPFPGAEGPAFFLFDSKTPFYFIALAMLVGIVYLSYWFNRTRVGYYWRAMRSDPDAAESLGINVGKYRFMTFLISCALTGIGGSFYAQYFSFIDPTGVLDLTLSIQIVLVGVVGGWQTIFGPMIGSFIITPIGQLVRAQLGSAYAGLHLVVYGIILMLFIMYIPRGLNAPFMRGIRWLETKYWHPSRNANNEKARRQ
jgi:branched-chain amino acid transport system permease protein